MKKIKFLNVLMIVFLICGTIGVATNLIFLIVNKDFTNDINYNETVFGSFTPYISALLSMLLITGIYNIQRALFYCLKFNYFNLKSGIHFKKAGVMLIIFGLLCATFDFFNHNFGEKEFILMNYVTCFLVLVVGISLTAVADIVKKGEVIEQENLLTI